MYPLLIGTMLAMSLGPMGSDPAREPQLAANGSLVAMTYGAGTSIYFAGSNDGGKTFSPPVKVSEAAIVPLTRHRGPRIVIAGKALVITAVTGHTPSQEQHAHGLPSDGDLIAWRSTDRGRTWSKGVTVNDVPGSPTEGLHGLAAGNDGMLYAAWLDKRTGKGTQLYGARSLDRGLTWTKSVLLYQSPDGTICECCHPSVAIDSAGRIAVMWRNWLDGSRDMYLIRSAEGANFSKPIKLGADTWKLNACPMDGGGLAIVKGHLVSAWRRDHSIYLASPGESERKIGEGTDVAISAGPQGLYAIWSTPNGIRAVAPGHNGIVSISAKGSFASIAALPDGGALAAWEEDDRINIKMLR